MEEVGGMVEVEKVEEEVEYVGKMDKDTLLGLRKNMRATVIMGFRATGQEAKVTPKSRPTTPDLGASWVRTPPTLPPVRSS